MNTPRRPRKIALASTVALTATLILAGGAATSATAGHTWDRPLCKVTAKKC